MIVVKLTNVKLLALELLPLPQKPITPLLLHDQFVISMVSLMNLMPGGTKIQLPNVISANAWITKKFVLELPPLALNQLHVNQISTLLLPLMLAVVKLTAVLTPSVTTIVKL